MSYFSTKNLPLNSHSIGMAMLRGALNGMKMGLLNWSLALGRWTRYMLHMPILQKRTF